MPYASGTAQDTQFLEFNAVDLVGAGAPNEREVGTRKGGRLPVSWRVASGVKLGCQTQYQVTVHVSLNRAVNAVWCGSSLIPVIRHVP